MKPVAMWKVSEVGAGRPWFEAVAAVAARSSRLKSCRPAIFVAGEGVGWGMKPGRRRLARGFTLVEVMVSLGVFAFAIVVIIGALVAGGRDAGNDARRALAVDLLHNCFRELDLVKVPGSAHSPMLGLAPLTWGGEPVHLRLWFDVSGALVDSEQRAYYKADLTATRDAGAALGHLHGRVIWPARHGSGGIAGDVELFTSLVLP